MSADKDRAGARVDCRSAPTTSAALTRERVADGEIVYETDAVEPGDFVAYPGVYRERGRKPHHPYPYERDPRDWLEVRRVAHGYIYGVRVNPLDWEIEQEFAIYPLQIRDNGVLLVKFDA